jgi:predicted nucleotidyltransferase
MLTIDNIAQRIKPVLQKYPIRKAGIFGSYAEQTATRESDVDVLVDFSERVGLLKFVHIKHELEDALDGLKVDLIDYKAIKPLLKDAILKQEIKIYG